MAPFEEHRVHARGYASGLIAVCSRDDEAIGASTNLTLVGTGWTTIYKYGDNSPPAR